MAGEAKERMIAELLVVAVEGRTLLVAMNRIIGGINVQDEPLLVSTSEKGLATRGQARFEGFEPLIGCKNLIFKTAEGRLARGKVMRFSEGQSKGRVHPKLIGVIAVLIARPHLIGSLPEQLENGVIRVSRGPGVLDPGCNPIKNFVPFIDLP
jgi:hypothetical protein